LQDAIGFYSISVPGTEEKGLKLCVSQARNGARKERDGERSGDVRGSKVFALWLQRSQFENVQREGVREAVRRVCVGKLASVDEEELERREHEIFVVQQELGISRGRSTWLSL